MATLLVLVGVVKAWTIAQGVLNAILSANPLGLIVIAIAAVVAGIVLLVQNWDTVVAAFKSGIDSIKQWFNDLLNSPFITGITALFAGIWQVFTNGFDKAMSFYLKRHYH